MICSRITFLQKATCEQSTRSSPSPGACLDDIAHALIIGQLLVCPSERVHRHHFIVRGRKAGSCALRGFPADNTLRASGCQLAL